MGLQLASATAFLVGLCGVLWLCAITEPPWELFHPNFGTKHARERFGYFVEIILAIVVVLMLSGLALGALLAV
jgi:hypothetical protein